MRKNRTMRAAALLLVLTLITSCFVGGTFAKYTAEKEISDSAKVAKWSFKVGDADIAKSEEFSFAPFNGAELVKPGDSGSVTLNLTNASEVAAHYTVDFGVTASSPLTFSATESGEYGAIDTLDVDATNIAVGGTATVTLFWKWNSDADGTTDNAFGTAETPMTVEITAKVTATQGDAPANS